MANVRLRKAKFHPTTTSSSNINTESSDHPRSAPSSSTALVRRHFEHSSPIDKTFTNRSANQQHDLAGMHSQEQVQEPYSQEQKEIELKLIPIATSDEHLMLELINRRNQDIHKIEKDVLDVHASFKVLHSLVQQQGERIDQIDANTLRSRNKVERSLKELKQAESYLARKPL